MDLLPCLLRIATPRVRTTSVKRGVPALEPLRCRAHSGLCGRAPRRKKKNLSRERRPYHTTSPRHRQLSATRGTAPPENATSCTPSTSSGVPDRSSDHPLQRDPLRTSISHSFSASMHFGNSALSAKRAPRTLRFPSASHPPTCRGLGSFLEVASRLRSVLAAPSCPVPQDMLVASMMCTLVLARACSVRARARSLLGRPIQ